MTARSRSRAAVVHVSAGRLDRWVLNFERRHPGVVLRTDDGALFGSAPDGAWFIAALPFSRAYDGAATPSAVAKAAEPPPDWGLLLVRKGGFAVARMAGTSMVAHKIGQRHVQGRTKAGGQSQQRFARRRDNQARAAYQAAAEHAARVLGEGDLPVVLGGDRRAAQEVLRDARLSRLTVVGTWLEVPDPRRSVLDAAIGVATSLLITVDNAEHAGANGED